MLAKRITKILGNHYLFNYNFESFNNKFLLFIRLDRFINYNFCNEPTSIKSVSFERDDNNKNPIYYSIILVTSVNKHAIVSILRIMVVGTFIIELFRDSSTILSMACSIQLSLRTIINSACYPHHSLIFIFEQIRTHLFIK